MELSKMQRKQLQKALISAFPTHGDLAQMVSYHLDEDLETIAAGTKHSEVVFNLINWARAQGRLMELIQEALQANDRNEELRAFAEELQLQSVSAMYDTNQDRKVLDISKVQIEEGVKKRQKVVRPITKMKNTSGQTQKGKQEVFSSSISEKSQPDILKNAYRYHSRLKKFKKPLQNISSLFRKGDIYMDLCERAIEIIGNLNQFVLKFRDDIIVLSYQVKMELNHLFEEGNDLISDITTFRGDYPSPPSIESPKRGSYDDNRSKIYRKLDALLRNLKFVDHLLEEFFTRVADETNEMH